MAENSAISWTDCTFNPWEGCEKVSPGCKNCYAERRDIRLHSGDNWGPGSKRLEHSEAYWKKPMQWQRQAQAKNEQWRVFCGSLCDILEHRRELDPLRERVFDLVPHTPNLLWLFLTKRVENWEKLPAHWHHEWPRNAMFGFTAEEQGWLERRREQFIYGPAKWINGLRTFLSCEPLLGPLDLGVGFGKYIEWVIAGGESGSQARVMHPDWPRSLRDQCAREGVRYHFKQWGSWREVRDGDTYNTAFGRAGNPPAFIVRRSGIVDCFKNDLQEGAVTMLMDDVKRNGRLLDGKEWNEIPEAKHG